MTHESFDADEFDDLKFELPPLPPEAEAPMREFLDKIRTPLASGEPRRHHFLPQFFLRRFANENNQLAVVRLDDPDIYDVTNVENVAVMKDLYTTIDAEIGETAAVEKMLAVADGEAKKAIARLAFGLFFPPQGVDRANLAIWFGLLHVRDPYTRRRMEALADQIYKLDLSIAKDAEAARARLRKNMGKEPDDEEVKALVEAASNLDSFEVSPHQNDLVHTMLGTAISMVPHFLARLYSVVRFPEQGLVLCDRPMVLYQKPEHRSPLMGVGLINADEIWLPLNRSTALILHRDVAVGETVIDAPLSHSVDDFNQAVVLSAHSEIYCHPDDLDRLEGLELPDADRPLIVQDGGWMKVDTDGVNKPPARRLHRRYRRQK